MESLKRNIKLKTLDSKVFPIEVDRDIRVVDLKKIVSETTKIPVQSVRMISKARPLKDQEKLSQHITQDDQTIHVMNKPPPPQQQQQQQQQPPQPQQPSQPNINFSQNSGSFQSFQTPNGSTTISSIQIPDGDTSNIGGLLGNLLQGVVGDSGNANSIMSVRYLMSASSTSGTGNNPNNANQNNSSSSSNNNQNSNSSGRVNIMRGLNLGPGSNSSSIFQPPNPVLNTMSNPSSNNNNTTNSTNANTTPAPPSSSPSQPGRFNLPYQTIYRINQTINNVYNISSFPGPSLPSTTHPRNPITQMGQYLLSLNFALNRLSPLLLRTGQLLSREHFLDGNNSRRETQRFSNYLGVAMHELSIALINVSHLYRNMTLGENQGQFQISAQAPQFFRPIIDQNSGARNYNNFNRALNDRGFHNQRGPLLRSGGANIEGSRSSNNRNNNARSSSGTTNTRNNNSNTSNNNNNSRNDQQEELKQQIVIQVDLQDQLQENDDDFEDIDEQEFEDAIQEQIIDVTIPSFQQSTTQNQVNAQPPPPQPTTTTHVLSTPNPNPPQQQPGIPSTGPNMLNSIHQALNTTPQGQMAQNMLGGMMPMINRIVSNSQGARTIGEIAANMQASQLHSEAQSQGIQVDIEEIKEEVRKEEEENKSLMAKVIENLEIQDIFAIINVNLGKLMHMVPKIQKLLKQEMEKNPNSDSQQVDTPENRKFVAKRISQAVKIQTPSNMKDKIKAGYDPVMHSSHIVERQIYKLVTFFMDFKKQDFGEISEEEIIERFSVQFKSKLRNFVGKLIDQLKEVFFGGVDDEELNEPPNGPMSMMMSNLIMGYASTGYQQYQAERDAMLIQRRISEQNLQGEEDKEIQLNKRNSQQLLKQWKEIIDKDVQIQKNQESQRPLSRMYRTLNAFLGLGSGIMSELQEYGVTPNMSGSQEEQKEQKAKLSFLKDKMDILERRIRSTLNSKGYEKSAIDKSFESRPIPIMLSKKYKTLLREQLKERAKTDPDYEEGKWEKLDKLLKE